MVRKRGRGVADKHKMLEMLLFFFNLLLRKLGFQAPLLFSTLQFVKGCLRREESQEGPYVLLFSPGVKEKNRSCRNINFYSTGGSTL